MRQGRRVTSSETLKNTHELKMRRMGLNALSAALQEVADAHVVGTKD